MKELTAEQAEAYLEARKRLEIAIENASRPVTLEATRARVKADLKKLEEKYSDEELARALYGEDYI